MRQFSENDTSKWTYRFGRGGAGDSTISSSASVPLVYTQLANGTYSSGATSLTLASATGFATDDLVLIHQSRGTSGVTAGGWELNRISNLVSTTATLEFPLENTYIHEAGARKVQIIKLTEYNNLTVNSSVNWTVPNWSTSDGKGGLLPLMVKETFTLDGQLIANGGNGSAGSSGTPAGGTGAGYAGGAANYRASTGVGGAFRGEGTAGDNLTRQTSANGNGAGGGSVVDNGINTGSGGGGGASAAGGNGNSAAGGTAGTGGSSVGSTDLTAIFFGGGGGGGARGGTGTNEIAGGGSGAGVVMIFAKTLTLGNGAGNRISAIGGNSSGAWWPGGGGGGGAVLIKCIDATLQTNKIVATGGTSTSLGSSHGGNGATGRVHIDYANSYSGSTNPTLDVNQDNSLFPPAGGAWFLV